MEPTTPPRTMMRVRSEEPYSTPVKSYEPRSRELTPSTYAGSIAKGSDWLRHLEQQVAERLRKDAYLLSTLKRSMQKDVEEQLQLARRELEVFFARELRAVRDSTTVEVQAIASEIKTLRRGGSEHLAEAVAKLCVELDHITKDSATQSNLQASMGQLRAEMEEALRKHGVSEERRRDQLAEVKEAQEDVREQLKELKAKLQERQDHWYMARRQNWEDCVQKISGLKEEMEEQRQSIHCERQTQQELRGAWATLNEKLEALRLDMARGSQPEMAMLTEDLAEVRRQMKRRDEEGTLGRLANLEEEVLAMKPQQVQLAQLREHVVKLSSARHSQDEAFVEQRVAQLEGSVLELQKTPRASPSRQELPGLTKLGRDVANISAQQERNCEQLAILEEKLTSLWTLTPRICELEHQQKEFWRLQEQIQNLSSNVERLVPNTARNSDLALELSEQRQAACERRLEQLRGELSQYITSVVDVRDEMRKLLNQQNDHLLKAIGENYSGCLDRLSGLERQLHDRVPESRLKMLLEESTSLERRLGCLERQMEGQSRALDASQFEQLMEMTRRPIESRISALEQLQPREVPSPEPRLASMERRLREGQEEHARQLRGFQERCESMEVALSRLSAALPRLSKEILSDWEAMASERFADVKVSQDLQRLSQRFEKLPESLERCNQELTLYQRRLDLLPEATSQQLQRLNEDLGTVKSQLAVLDSEQTRCRLGALEDAMKTISWDLDGAEKQLKELSSQFSSVAQMQSQMQNLDGCNGTFPSAHPERHACDMSGFGQRNRVCRVHDPIEKAC